MTSRITASVDRARPSVVSNATPSALKAVVAARLPPAAWPIRNVNFSRLASITATGTAVSRAALRYSCNASTPTPICAALDLRSTPNASERLTASPTPAAMATRPAPAASNPVFNPALIREPARVPAAAASPSTPASDRLTSAVNCSPLAFSRIRMSSVMQNPFLGRTPKRKKPRRIAPAGDENLKHYFRSIQYHTALSGRVRFCG